MNLLIEFSPRAKKDLFKMYGVEGYNDDAKALSEIAEMVMNNEYDISRSHLYLLTKLLAATTPKHPAIHPLRRRFIFMK